MGQEIGQTSQHQPAVVFDGSGYHMVFLSNDDTNRIIYVTSPDGENNWTLGPDTGQTSGAAPAVAVYQLPSLTGGPLNKNLLVLVFIANDPSNRVLFSILDLSENPNNRGWRFEGQVGGESAHGVFALATQSGTSNPSVTVYFTSNDSTNRLLEHQLSGL
jgi:hypothetical protein